MEFIYNPAYSPQANPIEECFAQVKKAYKKAKLSKIINGTNVENEDMIEKAFEKITCELVHNCVMHSNKLIDKS